MLARMAEVWAWVKPCGAVWQSNGVGGIHGGRRRAEDATARRGGCRGDGTGHAGQGVARGVASGGMDGWNV
ncbi:hypothetical protein E2562_038612 [Oryza meyeriana var. granulata]|uniref:Uncharacterized protein n=1 Tax=Oryza meyeriana var. granulata TaxID=110450 RepID=A0A6G1CXR3_9ORYZ|nr:hypothetical protein E2562_038612 [Oryza meyeriana var. granulata]